MKKITLTILSFILFFTSNGQTFNCGDTLTDNRDGKKYLTILLGNQCWMKQNLNYGVMINHTTPQSNNGTPEKFCYNDDSTSCDTLGGLYQWSESMQYSTTEETQGLCPLGWHLPSDAEWKILEMHLGMSAASADSNFAFRGTDEAIKLITGGSSGFEAPFSGAFHGVNQSFSGISNTALYWTSSIDTTTYPFRRGLYDFDPRIYRGSGNVGASPLYGYSVRCILNKPTGTLNFDLHSNPSILPNPANNYFQINGNENTYFQVKIIDLNGRVLKTWQALRGNTAMDIHDLSNGLYFVQIFDKVANRFNTLKLELLR